MSGELVGKTADGYRRHSFNSRVAKAQRRAEAEARQHKHAIEGEDR